MASRQQQKAAKGSGSDGRPTKAERRELARRQRQELQRKMARARRTRRIGTWALVAGVVAVVAVLWMGGQDEGPSRTGTLAGMMTGTQPWPANIAELGDRLDVLDLPPAGGALHIHSHVSLFVDGEPVAVPQDVGIAGSTHASLHTHDAEGVVHIESANPGSTFTLGEFFDVWGLRLSTQCMGGYCAEGKRALHVFVDGEEYTGDPRQIQLADQRGIVIAFGTEDEIPDPLPTFDWSELVA